jgi:hypothetical protein
MREGVPVSKSGKIFGLVITFAMLVFSTYIFSRTGDWVAAVFMVGSMAYGVVFLSGLRSKGS